ncbi:MAG TPA: non-homologous end-joining DNA ligase [Rhizomicrobium sp.]|jgi:bifunctional non-homologous end joining protein LigD
MAARKPAPNSEVLGVTISHPEKELWPKSKAGAAVTKLALARYYEAAAARMLPHISERPISIVRTPDGIRGPRFFQRHAAAGSGALAMKIKGESKPFLAVNSAEALVSLAQLGAVEIHPWGSAKGDPERPGRIVFDLDPAPELPFARVIEGARDVRDRLTALGLVPFVKTTGGKGLHVVIAVGGNTSWSEAKTFAKALALAMERDSPDRYTTTLAKSARHGKIFIDIQRNDRMASSVAPWSPRARDGAPISVPLEWSQIKHGLDPDRFTIATSGPLLRKSDPWQSLAKSARAIGPVMKKLLRQSQA